MTLPWEDKDSLWDRLGDGADDLTVDDVQAIQRAFDSEYWSGPGEGDDKRRHILLHLVCLTGKLARVEERADHGVDNRDGLHEAIADLLVFAAQLADIEGRQLSDLWSARLRQNAQRLPRSNQPDGSFVDPGWLSRS